MYNYICVNLYRLLIIYRNKYIYVYLFIYKYIKSW